MPVGLAQNAQTGAGDDAQKICVPRFHEVVLTITQEAEMVFAEPLQERGVLLYAVGIKSGRTILSKTGDDCLQARLHAPVIFNGLAYIPQNAQQTLLQFLEFVWIR